MNLLHRLGSAWRWLLQPLLVIAILVLGFVGATGLVSSREALPTVAPPSYAPLVRVISTTPGSVSIVVSGNGAIRARTRIRLVPQVGGEVLAIHPGLRPGGRFAAGDALLRIEPRDFELAVARTDADVATARKVLAQETAQAETALEEWATVHGDEPIPDLVARRPQIAEAEARLAAAEANAETARLDLARTILTLPFDGRVVESTVDVGEVVMPNQALATVYDTRVLEVPVPLGVDDLRWIQLPSDNAGTEPSDGEVALDIAGARVALPAHAVRVEGEADPLTRMVRVVLEIRTAELDPWLRTRLLPGLFVDVSIDGGAIDDVTELPRAAMREGGVVWVVEDGRLRFRIPVVRRSGRDAVFVSGLDDGTDVVVSNLEVVVEGMQVRTAEGGR